MKRMRLCIDVSDLDAGIDFYTKGLKLEVARRLGPDAAELRGAPLPIDLLARAEGSGALPGRDVARKYTRHWTPIHIDLVVDDIEQSIARALAAGAVLEIAPHREPYGTIAQIADPFGNGICLLEPSERGYDAVASPSEEPARGSAAKELQIAEQEERLRRAMLSSDVAELDRLLDDQLLFVGPEGALYRKRDDLAAHERGVLRLSKIEPKERTIEAHDDVVVVSVLAELAGTFAETRFDGLFRYQRTWLRKGDDWRIVAGSVREL